MAELLFQQPKQYQPKAGPTETADVQFKEALNTKLQTDYADIMDKYERKQLSDTDVSSLLEQKINEMPDEGIKQEWQPKLTEVKYQVFKNAQGLQDMKIENGIASGAITYQQGMDMYNEMARVAESQESRSALIDAETYKMKAIKLNLEMKMASRSGGGGYGGGSGGMSTTDWKAVKNFEENLATVNSQRDALFTALDKIKYNYTNKVPTMYNSQQIVLNEQQYNEVVDNLWKNYNDAVASFAKSDALESYYLNINPDGLDYLASHLHTLDIYGQDRPYVYSGYEEDLAPTMKELNDIRISDLVPQPVQEETGAEPGTPPVSQEQNPFNPFASSIQSVKPVAQETQRQSNPLGL